MRGTFVKTLAEIAERDPRVVLLTGDLGFMALEPFSNAFPDRFFNAGVAEQNMVGLATGLAEAGFIPFVYSIVTFASLRPYEFIRNGPILHQLPVRIIGVGGGFEYGSAGITHFGLDDIGVMRVQPGMSVIAPADYQQARTALLASWEQAGPIYYRIGKDDRTVVPGLDGRFEAGRAQLIREGSDMVFVTTGAATVQAARAAEALAEQDVRCGIVVVPTLNPPPTADLIKTLSQTRLALTVEAHYIVGGVGSLVSEVVAEHDLACRVVRRGVRSMPHGISGSQSYLDHSHGISSEALISTALEELRVVT